MIILVLLCLLIIALKWLPKLIKLDGQIIALKLFQHFTLIANEWENMSPDDYNSLTDSAVLIKHFLLKHSVPLVKPTRKNKKFCAFFSTNVKLFSLLTGVILPLFKGKGAKANNKDNYRGIALFPTLCKIYEMVLLNRSEKFAEQQGLFSNMQFGFKEGVGCTEASFTILESINHVLERGSKVFGCFLDVRKAFDTVWIDSLLFKLFSEFGIKGRMWLVIRNLYTCVKAQVLYSGSLSKEFDILQGKGQGRIPAPFMYN